MARRTKEDAQKTREAIMRAAEDLFYEKGVTQTSLHQIAVKAGVTRGAIYWHFKDKVDVLHAIADANFLPNEELMEHLSSQDLDDPIESLRMVSRERMDEMINKPERRRVMTILTQRCEYVEEMGVLADRHEQCKIGMYERIKRLFTQAKNKGKLAKAWTPETAAYALQHLFIGFVTEEMEYAAPSKERDKWRHEAMDAFYDALSSK